MSGCIPVTRSSGIKAVVVTGGTRYIGDMGLGLVGRGGEVVGDAVGV